jgi:hypothetical protein
MDEEHVPQTSRTQVRKELLALLDSQDWDSVLQDLLAFTYSTLRDRIWLGVWGGHVPGAREAHDIVMGSVTDIIDGIRSADDGVPLIAVLKSVIRSKISGLATSLENLKTSRFNPYPDEGEVDQQIAPHRPLEHGREQDDVVSKETEEVNSQLLDLLIGELSDEPDLQKIIECNIDGVFKREEIATRLGKTVSEITNMGKRLKRRLLAFSVKFADKNPFTEPNK